MALSQKIKLLDIFKGKNIWASLLPIFIASYLLFSMVSISLSQIFLTLSLIVWIILLIREKQKFTFPSFFWPLLVYTGLSLVSAFLSVAPKVSLKDSRDLLLFIIVPIVYMGFSSVKTLQKVNLALLISAYVACFYSLSYLIFKASPSSRISGFMGQVMTQAGLLLLFSCMALSMFLLTRSKIRYLWGLGFFIALWALIFTQTRNAWIGLVIASSLILFLYRPRALIIMPLAIMLLFFVSPKPIKMRVIPTFRLKERTTYRIEYMKAGVKIIKDYPLFGTGSNTVEMVFQDPKYGLSEKAKKNVHLHNNILQISAERGIPTLITWLVFIGMAFFSLLKLLKNKDPTLRPFTIAALGAISGLFAAGFFEYNFADSEITTLFLYLITVPFALTRVQRKEPEIEKIKVEKPLFDKKKILLIFIIFLLIYAFWLSIKLLTFKTYKSSESEASPLEVEGAYHIHSVYSDGTKDLDKIAKIAARVGLDFIILTDHGAPNLESYANQGWKEGVLVLAGTEISVSRGHLVALGFKLPPHRFSQKSEHAVYEIIKAGGFSVISHPYSKTRWSWGEFVDYSGIEIMNADSMFRRNMVLALPYLPTLLLKPEYFFLKTLIKPRRNIRKWDELNNLHPIYGYFSADAHLFYRPILGLFRIHILLESALSSDFETAKNQIYEALRKGRFYNSIPFAANSDGFRFWAEKGKESAQIGGTIVTDAPVTIHIEAPFSFSKEIFLYRGGRKLRITTDNSIDYKTIKPGIYRVEVYLRERSPLDRNVPWIISNPIFLREVNNDGN